MALSHSPRKVVPLATGDDMIPRIRAKSTVQSNTKRVFFCGVVVEGSDGGREIAEDVQDLIASLGEPFDLELESESVTSSSTPGASLHLPTGARRRTTTNSSAFGDILNELVATERSYVNRLKTLKNDYADPLRMFARSKDTAILPPYEAKTLFGNIDNLLPVNEAFLGDLEKMSLPGGPGVGDVALKHFKQLRGFEHYKQYYSKREEAQAIFEREMKKSSGFAAFVERIKYSSTDTKNRVGLRELLMEPVQRIPRYTLMFRTMIKHMAPGDPQHAALVEADEIASRIALAETDEQTKRAAIMYCLSSSIDDFPPALVSHGRRFVDCIDVEDVLLDGPASYASANTSSQMGGNLSCTLFLFDDKLMIVKRPGNGEKSGRALAGLDDPDKMAKASGRSFGKKKSGLSCKGVVDVTDVVATDIGGSDFHVYFETAPSDQGDRWSDRPFRAFSTVRSGSAVTAAQKTEVDKTQFLENLWDVQARFKTKKGQSVVLRAPEREVENKGGKTTVARTYFNVYTRMAFLQETKKSKIVLHIDPLGSADPIPFGIRGPPLVIVRVQPLAGELCRYKVTSAIPSDDDDEDIVQTARVPERIVHTTHQYGLFKFHTGINSVPSTPTASSRSRVNIFGLDAISRNLFNARPGSAMGDLFGGSTNSHRRSRTYASRTSTMTGTTSSGDGSFSRFSRTNSTLTAATSIMDDESMKMSTSSRRSRSLSRAKKLMKRGKSPRGEGSVSEPDTSPQRLESSFSRSPSREPEDEDGDLQQHHMVGMDPSERDLALRLELARRNSQNQNEQKFPPLSLDPPLEDTIYEEDPNPSRPFSRSSRRELPNIPADSQSQRSTTPRLEPNTPTRAFTPDMGPRTPSPLPPTNSYLNPVLDGSSVDVDLTLETTLVDMAQPPVTPIRSPIPRSKRQPFEPAENLDSTPKANEASRPPSIVEPLSIKKKISVRSNTSTITTSPTFSKKASYSPRISPKGKVISRNGSPRRAAAQTRSSRIPVPQTNVITDTSKDIHLVRLVETTKQDLESCRRTIKRIRLEADRISSAVPASTDMTERPASPFKGMRMPQTAAQPLTREAQARMEELRQLIGRRNGESTRITRPQSLYSPSGSSSSLSWHSNTPPKMNEISRSIEDLVDQADSDLEKAIASHETLQAGMQTIDTQLKDTSTELERTNNELQSAKRQCTLVKDLLADCTSEQEILYKAFNEELDGMFNDATLPEDEAWAAMTKDLRKSKEARNALSLENSRLKRRLVELEMQNKEWGALLRAHGLIP
ncbi:uncharacterized protein FIBRA_00262 [Fibroporia radiculosa]|uniref:DH domain-containing protein n=1 Tax=Fibroporia radiculosa TaxID=599839 RepID=J7SCN5_9APHY|nr:uncharacterized protein FIBRA_00262 [Fibroporia radiculosa]CCL98268.1 predicted protein [Fibroporia radiculosa]